MDFTQHWAGYIALICFIVAYAFVVVEEMTHLRKSKPLMVAAGLIWVLVAFLFGQQGHSAEMKELLRHNMLEFSELFLFLLAAMTYINTISERQVFDALQVRLASSGMSLRGIYWLTGVLAFFMSPLADNLTTALVMGAVVVAVGASHKNFIVPGCINVVVAANAGGAFSPFGDITTLMVWQKGIISFWDFFVLFFPALVSWLIPALFMSFSVPRAKVPPSKEKMSVKDGGYVVVGLFFMTILMTVLMQHILGIPPFFGMMTGLGILTIYGFFLRRRESKNGDRAFDIFVSIKRVEWDTLMFFYGVIMCVGGLSALGYLRVMSDFLYGGFGATVANISIGPLSAVIDNIPLMFAVLNMGLEMDKGQWLLVTLTAGIGGSLLSIGSAAGVALMGQARGFYTFLSHLKWSWAIAIGYAAGVFVHIVLNMGE